MEAWWSQLQSFKTSWWIDMCKVGLFCTAFLPILEMKQGLQTEELYDNSNVIERYWFMNDIRCITTY